MMKTHSFPCDRVVRPPLPECYVCYAGSTKRNRPTDGNTLSKVNCTFRKGEPVRFGEGTTRIDVKRSAVVRCDSRNRMKFFPSPMAQAHDLIRRISICIYRKMTVDSTTNRLGRTVLENPLKLINVLNKLDETVQRDGCAFANALNLLMRLCVQWLSSRGQFVGGPTPESVNVRSVCFAREISNGPGRTVLSSACLHGQCKYTRYACCAKAVWYFANDSVDKGRPTSKISYFENLLRNSCKTFFTVNMLFIKSIVKFRLELNNHSELL